MNDFVILNERIDLLKEKTPDLAELHINDLYVSPDNDKKFDKLEITHVQTAIVI